MTAHRIALVTGANKGIGYEIARQLSVAGWTVLAGARDPQRLAGAVATLHAGGHGVHPVDLDVTDARSVAGAAAFVDERFGHLDALVNNAGISGPLDGQAPGDTAVQTVRAVFETNVFGIVAVTEAMLPLLRRSAAARIVNVSSSVGSLARMTDPASYLSRLPGALAYPPSKSAVTR